MLRRIASWAFKNKISMGLTGIDINPWSKKSAESHSSVLPISYETSDVFTFALDRKTDIIISGIFTHHLSNETLVRFIKWMDLHTNHGWFINDLHRHPLPYYFIKYATRIFSRNRLIQNDAPVSVARAFTKKDWQSLLIQTDIPLSKVSISWFFPFRYCVGRYK